MKPLAPFGTPHNALVYVSVSHMHMPAFDACAAASPLRGVASQQPPLLPAR